MRKLSFIIVLLALSISCSTMKTEFKLDPAKEDFLSLVRYIITKEEEDIFKQYPPSEREEFVEKFWARRDPTPYTVRNEYKEDYLRRIEEANKLFKGGIAGWLQDRGRIYILFGAPSERTINPGGRPMDPFAPAQELDPAGREARASMGLGEKPSETWIYYKLLATQQVIKIDFVDRFGTGNYKLVTNIEQLAAGYLDTFITPTLSLIHELSKQESQVEQQQALLAKKILFNFQWKFVKEQKPEKESNLLMHMEIPYERILFSQKDDLLVVDMELFIEIRDAEQNIIWHLYDTYNLSFSQRKIKSEKEGKWILNVPVTHWLAKGKYSVYIHLLNLSVDQDVKKLLELQM